ncbi:hypothetical protein JKP88DRAFT_17749 [Tribonema minus]|uniref:Phosducin thioredoxin-like domain-containing protein n=1 Tax=Tribonema minus TaxID=303371 RepID=A0A836CLT7_9STRA|nr:hypothetical protein JKP88DRAFT_17749 [Tribonema minus]
MDPCCQKEAIANRKMGKLMDALRKEDRVAKAEQRRKVIAGSLAPHELPSLDDDYPALVQARLQAAEKAPPEATASTAPQRGPASDSGDSDSDSDYDHLLDELELEPEGLRLRQAHMEAAAQQLKEMQQRAAYGYGQHQAVHEADLPHIVQRLPRVIVHFYCADSAACAALDLLLERAAQEWPGTRFVRARAPPGGPLADRLGLRHARGGALLAFKDGASVAQATDFRQFGGPDSVDPGAVHQWLQHSGALERTPLPLDALNAAMGGQSLADEEAYSSGGEEEGGGARYDCGRSGCNKPFAHQHVGANGGGAAPGALVAPGVGQLRA